MEILEGTKFSESEMDKWRVKMNKKQGKGMQQGRNENEELNKRENRWKR